MSAIPRKQVAALRDLFRALEGGFEQQAQAQALGSDYYAGVAAGYKLAADRLNIMLGENSTEDRDSQQLGPHDEHYP